MPRADGSVAGGGPRSFAARLGIVMLNLPTPGLGLLRLGKLRLGLGLAGAPIVFCVVLTLGAMAAPSVTFAAFVVVCAFLSLLVLGIWGMSALLSWKFSTVRGPLRWWSRWYGLLAISAMLGLLTQLAVGLVHRVYKPFWAASTSMEPTFLENDRFLVEKRFGKPFSYGQLVVFRGADGDRIARIVALPGDWVEVSDGVPVVNARLAIQKSRGMVSVSDFDGPMQMKRLSERLPGEQTYHEILDAGPTILDFFGPIRVPTGHVFLMGDNRDRSGDSRVQVAQGGVGMVRLDALVGRPLFTYWSRDRERIGHEPH